MPWDEFVFDELVCVLEFDAVSEFVLERLVELFFFDVDVLVVRILFACLFLFGSFGGWVYIILWIAVPAARTSAEKCRMHGLPVTAENMRRFYNSTN